VAFTAEDVYRMAPYARTLGVRIDGMDPAEVAMRLEWSEELSTVGGSLHGGALMGLADVAGAVCAGLNGPAGALPATMQSSTHFLHPVVGKGAFATCRPLRAGKSNVNVEIDIRDETGRLCVRVVQLVALRSAA
jgi:uncharacterized protein (TIGR00369 family)